MRAVRKNTEKASFSDGERILVTAFSAVVMTVTVAVLIAAGIFTVPRLFGIEPYIVRSGSMEPLIHTGAVAFINRGDKDISIGDVIAFTVGNPSYEELTVTHRVIGKNDTGWITKGDANDSADQAAVTEAAVVGTYLFSIPEVGYLLVKMDRPRMLLAAILLAGLNLCSAQLKKKMGEGDMQASETELQMAGIPASKREENKV